MSVRLAFAVTVEVDADILLIDEVLAVGDAAFQQKCFEQFEQLKRDGRTIVLVTHDMSAVERFCDRAMLIDRGRVLRDRRAARDRARLQRAQLRPPRSTRRRREAPGRGAPTSAEIKAAWFEDDAGERINATCRRASRCTMVMDVHFHAAMDEPMFALPPAQRAAAHRLRDVADWRGEPVGRFAAGETARVKVRFDNWLAPNRYTVSPSVAAPARARTYVDLREDLAALDRARRRATRAASPTSRTTLHGGARRDHRSHPPAPADPRAPTPSRFWQLTWTLAITDFKLRFYGSVLGYAWTLVRPFAFFGVIWFVFAEIVDAGDSVKNYPAYILMSFVLFQFFLGIVTTSLGMPGRPPEPAAQDPLPAPGDPALGHARSACSTSAMTLLAVFVFLAISGVYPTWSWLQLIPLIGILTVFGTGLGLLLSVLFVRFRDMRPIWDVAGQMLFYASPILYVSTMVPEDYQHPYVANPIAAVLTQMRHAVIDPSARTAAEAIGGGVRLLIPAAIVVVVAVLGIWAFVREAPRVAENL